MKNKSLSGKVFIVALLLFVLICFFVMIRSYLIALVLAAITAALLRKLHTILSTKFHGRKRLAAGAVLLIFIIVIGLPMIGLIILVANEAMKVGTRITPWVSSLINDSSSVSGFLSSLPFSERIEPFGEIILEKLGEIASSLGNVIINSIPDLTKGTTSFFLDLFIYLYALYYFLVRGSEVVKKVFEYIPLQVHDSEMIIQRGITVIRASLKGILVIGLLQGFLITLAFWVTSIPGAVFWGTIVVVLSAIPGVGTPIVWIPGAIYLVVNGQVGWSIGLVIWGALVVGLVDNILRPAVVGKDAKLPDLLILISILGGLVMFGAAGILIGPVLAAVVVTVLDIYRHMYKDELEG